MPGSVIVHGNGIAACCCVQLLTQEGLEVSFNRGDMAVSPTVLLNPSTQRLLCDVFHIDASFFAGWPEIRRRVVLWGTNTSPLVLPHSGIAVPERLLRSKLWTRLPEPANERRNPNAWSIYSDRRTATNQQFGNRIAKTAMVELRDRNNDGCWIESLASGWLFLLPCSDGLGTLLAVGDEPASLLARSRLVSGQICGDLSVGGEFPVAPRISECLAETGWLACGSAAMRFDPICGEGAGNAVREAILAAAVVRACVTNAQRERELLAHYSTRLVAGFNRHLLACRQFYLAGGLNDWWQSEAGALDRGLHWCASLLRAAPESRFRLNGFDLEPI